MLKEQIGHRGGSEILISLLKSRDLELQQAAAKLLRSISVNERNRDRLARDGAISVLVKAIATTEDFTLKLAATASLWNLSVNGTLFFPSPRPSLPLHTFPFLSLSSSTRSFTYLPLVFPRSLPLRRWRPAAVRTFSILRQKQTCDSRRGRCAHVRAAPAIQ